MRVDLFLFKPVLNNPFESRHIMFNKPEMKKHQIELEPPDHKNHTTQSQLKIVNSIPALQHCKLIIFHQIYSTRNQKSTHEKKTADYHSYKIPVVCLADTRIGPYAMVVKLSNTNLTVSTVFCVF